MAFDLIIFDCDGVLVDSEILAVQGMRSVLNASGVPATDAMILRCFGMKQADTLKRIAEETGRPIPPEVVPQLWPTTRALFQARLKPTPGIAAFLSRLGGRRRCVASSSQPERIATSLALAGLDGFFGPSVFSSVQVARGKPAPDLFLFAAERMGVAPERCAVIEDSIYGVMGARAAGMTAFGFDGGSHIASGHADALREAGADLVASDWPTLAGPLLGVAAQQGAA